jgi:hypothetical protein
VQEENEYKRRYLKHFADDVLPVTLRQAFAIAREPEKQ